MSRTVMRVEVWLAWRTAAAAAAPDGVRLVASLAPDEHRRAARYADPADGALFTWTRGVQRAVLGARLGVDPASLRFVQQGDGKPELAPDGPRCEYNASHSGDLFAIAVADAPVGLDVERARAVPGMDRIARRVLGATIADHLTALDPAARTHAFFTEWTRLEAHAKLHGHGVWRLLAERERHAEAEDVRTTTLALPAGYIGAVATARATPVVTLRWWPDDPSLAGN